ncbi:LmbU family transcriptional regulator [Streptomyces sp. APSN-46.1]|uniref:LmbU family transcriptional regulator n=1 Tax=Streptomyces sp. APSN-46.1 TaxID=2929049 RepID=UPI001FB4A700|nr:LmbU family transcriptional regulator [Streptomyces sp. APSN-46.1]MCJ1677925.1 LmbU family transcriptional regulator [Streptomyces sp. APSN-46.1]
MAGIPAGRGAPAGAPPLRSDRISLRLPARLHIDDWLHIGQTLTTAADSAAWWLGDWLVYGQDRYPERYRHAIDGTSLDYQTLRNYAWIARKFAADRRRAGLSMQHHAEVAAMSPALQDTWLDRAGAAGWSRNELRRRIRAEASSSPPATGTAESAESAELRLSVSAERHRQWEAAARRADRNLSDWILDSLDSASAAAINSATNSTPRQGH